MRLLVALIWVLVANCAGFAQNFPALTDSDFRTYSTAQTVLGQKLFYDRVLSGTYRVSCATCHNHDRASSNGFLLEPESASKNDELAINGLPLYDALKPSARHAPALFNLGAKQFQTLFSDGRVALVAPGKFRSPAGNQLPKGLRDVLAVQALFPAVTGDELVGTVESDVKAAAHLGNVAVWDALAKRVADLPDYWPLFQRAYPKMKSSEEIDIVAIANAISAFVGSEWKSTDSPFDRYLKGDDKALNAQQKRGMELFYGNAACSTCHSGALFTDHKFHNIGAWPYRFDADLLKPLPEVLQGRFSVTKNPTDRFKLRTPSLRNVERTAPYGYAGAYESLRDVIKQHWQSNPNGEPISDAAKKTYRAIVAGKSTGFPPGLSKQNSQALDQSLSDLVAFLKALTDEKAVKGRLGKPTDVPSSLVLD